MNLRQKNKKLKQELEMLKKKDTIPRLVTVWDNRDIIRLRHREMYDPSRVGPIPEVIMKERAARLMFDDLLPYIKYETYTDPISGNTIVEANLDIVV